MPEKILIVEDNPLNMKLMLMTLRNYGYTLLQATDGEEAIDFARREKPDLIIMDIRLHKMDGQEVPRRLRRMPDFKDTPIIAVTAHAMKGDREKFLGAGFDHYLPKPIDTRELPKFVAKILLSHQKSAILMSVKNDGKENPRS